MELGVWHECVIWEDEGVIKHLVSIRGCLLIFPQVRVMPNKKNMHDINNNAQHRLNYTLNCYINEKAINERRPYNSKELFISCVRDALLTKSLIQPLDLEPAFSGQECVALSCDRQASHEVTYSDISSYTRSDGSYTHIAANIFALPTP